MRENCSSGGNGGLGSGDRVILFSNQEPTSAYIGLTSTEIRSTLTTITGIHTLLLETTLSAEQRAYIASAQEATNGVLSLVNDLADFSLIEVAENGVGAVSSFGKKEYDLILMDGEMPILNGYDATRIIRKEKTTRGVTMPVHVCGMIAGSGGEEALRCLEAGMDDTITKPLNRTSLLPCSRNGFVLNPPNYRGYTNTGFE
jgi:CheY-like chemotaxis protein